MVETVLKIELNLNGFRWRLIESPWFYWYFHYAKVIKNPTCFLISGEARAIVFSLLKGLTQNFEM